MKNFYAPKIFFGYWFGYWLFNFVLVAAITIPYYFHTRNSYVVNANCCFVDGIICNLTQINITVYVNITVNVNGETHTSSSQFEIERGRLICNTTSTIDCYYDNSNISGSLTIDVDTIDTTYSGEKDPEILLGVMIGVGGVVVNLMISFIEGVATIVIVHIYRSIKSRKN